MLLKNDWMDYFSMFQLSMLVFVAMNMKEKNQFFFGNKNLFILSSKSINEFQYGLFLESFYEL